MLLFKKVGQLQAYLKQQQTKGEKIGYVPTMGALHEGHASLIKKAKVENDLTVCSIFVNPTQFNDPSDLKKYPRTEAQDIELLAQLGNDVLFYPSVEEIYPKGIVIPTFDFGQADKVMEGHHRPGHFEGVVQVVYRLLDIVQPDSLYMGQKDFQQFTLIYMMLQQMGSNIELVVCPIIREVDGLALSSRNVRLSPENRKNAPLIAQTLSNLKDRIFEYSIPAAKEKALAQLSEPPNFTPEYLEVVDGYTLQAISDYEESPYIVACAAVWAGAVRLIDNVILKKIDS